MSNVLYVGRFDKSVANTAYFSNPGCALKINFNGTSVTGQFKKKSSAKKTTVLFIIIDGNDSPNGRAVTAVTTTGYGTYSLASGLATGDHTLEIVCNTEYYSGAVFNMAFGTQGFTITGGTGLLTSPSLPSRFIEYYGDSGAAGWTCWNPYDAGTYTDGEGYFSFPQVAARALGAYCHNNSQSSAGITTYSSPQLQLTYDLINPADARIAANIWGFTVHPDVACIHLSSNDSGYSDSYFTSRKPVIQQGWADFRYKLRQKHPNAHICIVESYGWASYEPSQYLEETVATINTGGFGYDADTNVSACLVPWIWGQQHCVINEHAGFGNIIANHLATVMSWSTPTYDTRSTLPDGTIMPGDITNSGFESAIVSVGTYKLPDGVRPSGTSGKVIADTVIKRTGTYSLKVTDERNSTPWGNWCTLASPGETFSLSAYIKGSASTTCKLKLQAMDHGQATLSSNEGTKSITTGWLQYTTVLTCPTNTAILWIVFTREGGNGVSAWFDDLTLTKS